MAVFGIGAKVQQVFQEDNGNTSSMRVLTALIVLVVLGNWTYFNVTTGSMVAFDLNDVMVMLAPLGVKAWQKGKEK